MDNGRFYNETCTLQAGPNEATNPICKSCMQCATCTGNTCAACNAVQLTPARAAAAHEVICNFNANNEIKW